MTEKQPISKDGITIRPARPEDTPQALELTKTIWDGEDYIPQVWEEWLGDPKGILAAVEHQERVIGFGKITEVTPLDWYLQGLRVDPQFQGRGVASVLHEWLVDWWERYGGGTLRLATHIERYPVHHLCERTGFTRLGEYHYYRAPAIQEEPQSMQVITIDEIDEALRVSADNPIRDLTGGIMDLPWVQCGPARETFEPAASLGHAFWWRGRLGVLVLGLDNDDAVGPTAYIQYMVCPRDELLECLLDARRVATRLERNYLGWLTLHNPDMLPILKEAGFERAWEGAVFIFEKVMSDE